MDLTPMKTIYFDMDGVLAKYDYNLYVPGPNGELAPFLKLKSHVFLNLEPEENVMEAFNELYTKYKGSDSVSIKVLTSIPTGLLQAEHTIDKFKWCMKYIKNFDSDDFFCTSVKKHDAISESLWQLTKYDVLIDDYWKNLENWREHGGRAVKFINGINSVNPDFDSVMANWTPKGIVNKIEWTLDII